VGGFVLWYKPMSKKFKRIRLKPIDFSAPHWKAWGGLWMTFTGGEEDIIEIEDSDIIEIIQVD
jgi:hypothetical protein